jgi:hypothetical protein
MFAACVPVTDTKDAEARRRTVPRCPRIRRS